MAWRTDRALTFGVTALVLLPVGAGVLANLPPAVGGGGLARLADWPGLGPALRLSLGTGLGSTLLATAITLLIMGCLAGTRGFAVLRRVLSPLLALPHAAAALGLAFLVAPSGWIVRAISPWATGWTAPPDLMILNDPFGLALLLGLAAKETPFLLLMALAAWPQTDAPRRMALTASLGYGRMAGFALGVMPGLMRQLRLPIHAVLAYGLTSVEMGMVLGPNLPPPLAVQVLRWAQAPGLGDQPTAAAGALVLMALVALSIAGIEGAARLAGTALPGLAASGRRGRRWDGPARTLALGAAWGMAAGLVAGLAGLALWSVAGAWPFPDAWPQRITLAPWAQAAPGLTDAGLTTLGLGLAATAIALALALMLLWAEEAGGRTTLLPLVIYLPLLIPQVALIPGLTVLMLRGGVQGGWGAVLAGHLAFVLPYVLLSLSDPWRAWDRRIGAVGASLGASSARIFWTLRLPMLLPAVLTAGAVGFAVSVGQYLPTLLLSGGRITTVTTEALALSAGGNRRLIGTYAVVQMVLPALGFLLALALPRVIFARRKAMLTP